MNGNNNAFYMLTCLSMTVHIRTVFTWLNVMITISHVLNFDAATIQGQPLIEGGIHCTEAHSLQLLFNIRSLIKLKTSEVNHAC